MKAQDLRIGNYFEYEKTTHVVKGMLPHCLHSYWLKGEDPKDEYLTKYEDGNPIPLTEEWLLKFGFEKDLRGFYTFENSQLIEVFFHDKGVQVCTDSICLSHIEYVHQIQNLHFSLYGKELELNTLADSTPQR